MLLTATAVCPPSFSTQRGTSVHPWDSLTSGNFLQLAWKKLSLFSRDSTHPAREEGLCSAGPGLLRISLALCVRLCLCVLEAAGVRRICWVPAAPEAGKKSSFQCRLWRNEGFSNPFQVQETNPPVPKHGSLTGLVVRPWSPYPREGSGTGGFGPLQDPTWGHQPHARPLCPLSQVLGGKAAPSLPPKTDPLFTLLV